MVLSLSRVDCIDVQVIATVSFCLSLEMDFITAVISK